MTLQRRSILVVVPLLAALAVALSVASTAGAAACSANWGGSAGNWNTASAWMENSVPDTTDEVCISSGQATLSTDATVLKVSVTGDGKLIVSNAALTADGPAGGNPDGAVTTSPSATLEEAGPSSTISGGSINNRGTVHIAATGTTRNLNFGTINNNAGILDVDESVMASVPGGSSLTNTGTIDIAAQKRLTAIDLTLNQNAGQITGGTNSKFSMVPGSINHNGGDVANAVTVGIAGGSINPSGTGTAGYSVGLDSGCCTQGTTLTGNVAAGKTLRVRGGEFGEGSAKLVLNAPRTNNGVIVLDSVNASGPNATLDLAANTLTNNGTLVVQRNVPGARTISGSGSFANAGAVNIADNVAFNAPITTQGTVVVFPGKTLTTDDDHFTQTGGTTALSGTVVTPGSFEFHLQGGALEGNGGTVQGNLINSGGNVSPGGSDSDPNDLNVTSDYRQSAGAVTIDITGSNSTDSDALKVGGDVELTGGALALHRTGTAGNVYEPLQAVGGLTGSFATLTGLSSGGRTYTVQYVTGSSAGRVRLNLVPQFTLTVIGAGAGAGSVYSSPAGITCGADCAHAFDRNSVVTLTATPATGSKFSGWSGSGCTGTGTCQVTMSQARSVTATFTDIDLDNDGSNVPADCNDLNSAIKPGATEIPGNDVDENCDGVKKPPTSGNDTINGTAAGETICALLGNDVVNGLGGNDTLFGDLCNVKAKLAAAAAAVGGNDTLRGGKGNDTAYGAGGNDKLFGDQGKDRLFGGGGRDSLDGGKGNDKLNGGAGVNKYKGGDGNDSINATNRKKETVDCGKGKKDVATVDKADKVKGCEKVKRAKK